MKYIDEFRDKVIISRLVEIIHKTVKRDYSFMEVCGGHTAAIHRFGIPYLLPPEVKLISGPGCPVCVTGTDFIDKAIAYSKFGNVIIATFGDLIKVPGSLSSLEKEMASGADVRIVLSGLDALEIARLNSGKKIIFLGIGFETTAPGTAVTLKQAEREKIKNFFVLSAHKVMPPAMEAIIKDGARLDGFICPGHVAAITGSSIFNFIPEKYNLGCVVTGFEPSDLLLSILMLIRQVNKNAPEVEIQYSRAVSLNGNEIALQHLYEVFKTRDASWRGFGVIPLSGLALREEFESMDIENNMPVEIDVQDDNEFCECGNIMRGLATPKDCPLFGSVCLPENPVGACMVSNEGTCHTWYKYENV